MLSGNTLWGRDVVGSGGFGVAGVGMVKEREGVGVLGWV